MSTNYIQIENFLENVEINNSLNIAGPYERATCSILFGYNKITGKIIISKYTYDVLCKITFGGYYTTVKGHDSIETILGQSFDSEKLKIIIDIYGKRDDKYFRILTLDIEQVKIKKDMDDSIIGRVVVNTNIDNSVVATKKMRQNLHDTKNQLMAIASLAGSIRKKTSDLVVKEYTYNIQDAVYNSNYLLNQAKGKTDLCHNKIINIHSMLYEHTNFLQNENNVSVDCSYRAKEHRVHGNIFLISNALQNIILNAVQAVDHRGAIGIKTYNKLSDRWGEKTAKIYIQISDDGVGIEAGLIEKIFENSFTTKDYGTGVGLYTSRQTIDSHGGDIEVKSESGKGSIFTVCLPCFIE